MCGICSVCYDGPERIFRKTQMRQPSARTKCQDYDDDDDDDKYETPNPLKDISSRPYTLSHYSKEIVRLIKDSVKCLKHIFEDSTVQYTLKCRQSSVALWRYVDLNDLEGATSGNDKHTTPHTRASSAAAFVRVELG